MAFRVGTIVVPMWHRPNETIIGVCVDEATSNSTIEVLWVSDTRGAFLNDENTTDVIDCYLECRDQLGPFDKAVNHFSLGKLLVYGFMMERDS